MVVSTPLTSHSLPPQPSVPVELHVSTHWKMVHLDLGGPCHALILDVGSTSELLRAASEIDSKTVEDWCAGDLLRRHSSPLFHSELKR